MKTRRKIQTKEIQTKETRKRTGARCRHGRRIAVALSALMALSAFAGCGLASSSASEETVAELNARIAELERENAYLEGRLDGIEGVERQSGETADRETGGAKEAAPDSENSEAAENGAAEPSGQETGSAVPGAEEDRPTDSETANHNASGDSDTSASGSGNSSGNTKTSSAEPDPNARAQGPWQPPAGVTLNPTNPNGSFREQHGALHVEGAKLVDQNGDPIQLYGMSTHGIAWYPEYVNDAAFRTLRDDWGVNCVRLALYADEYGGYSNGGNQGELFNNVLNGINHATNTGLYVIVDWHVLGEGSPLVHQDDAAAFFQTISGNFANYTNILYEICNEPNGSATWSDVKTYADAVIPVIRANDPDALIIVGTPTWSQDIDKALADPLPYDNVVYAFHFYAATHKDDLRDRLKTCADAGLPVFVSEFGICDASGNGNLDYDSAQKWLELLDSYNISYLNWNLSNKDESSAAIAASCKKTSDWSESELSASGQWVRRWYRAKAGL